MFTTVPFSELPKRYTGKLDLDRVFQGTTLTPRKLFVATEKLAREAVVKSGGRIEKGANGDEVFVIPVQRPKPSQLEQCWEAGPVANSKFTEEELAQIKPPAKKSN